MLWKYLQIWNKEQTSNKKNTERWKTSFPEEYVENADLFRTTYDQWINFDFGAPLNSFNFDKTLHFFLAFYLLRKRNNSFHFFKWHIVLLLFACLYLKASGKIRFVNAQLDLELSREFSIETVFLFVLMLFVCLYTSEFTKQISDCKEIQLEKTTS